MNLDELLGDCRREVQACAGPAPARETAARDPLALSRWRLYAALEESLRLHADSQAAVEVSHYLVVPFLPRQHVARAALACWRRGKLPTRAARAPADRRTAARCASTSAASTRCAPSSRPRGWRPSCSTASRSCALLWARFNPTKADRGRAPGAGRRAARRARRAGRARRRRSRPALRLKEAIAAVEPRLRARLAPARRRRPRRRADDRGRDDRGAHADGLAARGDADPPAVHACACSCTRSSAAASASG